MNDPPAAQRHRARAIAHREFDLMQRDQHSHAALAVQPCQQLHHAARRFGVERGHRLIGQQDLGTLDQRTRQRSPLLLSARQGRRALQGALDDVHRIERLECGASLVIGEAPGQGPPGRHRRQLAGQHVSQHRQAAHQIELLKDETDAAALLAHIGREPPVFLDAAPQHRQRATARIGGDKASDMAQQCRFTGTGGPDEGHHLAGLDGQIDAIEREIVTEAFAQRADLNGGSGWHRLSLATKYVRKTAI